MKRFNVLVGTIPVRDRQVLLLQRSWDEKFMPGAWGLPCGKIDFGEDLAAAALRELREESGLAGEVARLVGYSTFMSTKDGDELHNLQVNFLVAVAPGEVIIDHSSANFKWTPIAELANAGLDPFTIQTISQAFENLAG